MLSFFRPRKTPMTRLEQKLEQLKLPVMSQQLEKILTEATSKNLTVAATLEWLIDMELEARRNRAVDRRFKCSRLQVQLSIDTFHVIVQLPLYRSNQALDIFKKTLDIWKVMKYAGVDEGEGAPESGGWTTAA